MRKSSFTENQIVQPLEQEGGRQAKDASRE
jgi:hypothetical protein